MEFSLKRSLLKTIKFEKEIEKFSDGNLKKLNQRIDRLEFFHKFRCPTENYTTEGIKHGYKLIEEKCYFIQIISRTFKKTQEFCVTVFGPMHKGKIFEPRSSNVNNLVLKEALGLNRGTGQYFWMGVNNTDYKYISNGLPINLGLIPWDLGQPSTASKDHCISAKSSNQKWDTNYKCYQKSAAICEEI